MYLKTNKGKKTQTTPCTLPL